MYKTSLFSVMIATFGAVAAHAAQPGSLSVSSTSLEHGKPISEKYAFCAPDGNGGSKDGGNTSPEIKWSGAPAGTKSYALIVVDPDVPTVFDNANKPGVTLPADMPRQNFYHWVLTDIPSSVTSIAEGKDSVRVIKTGKPAGRTEYGISGVNDYGSFMQGTFGGYDGPCPPFNDERLHHYHFTVYALDTESLGLSGMVNGKQAMEAIAKHTLAKGEIVGTYTQNPKLR